MYTMLQLKAKGGCWKLLLSHFDSSHQTPVYPTHPDSLDGCALLCQFGCGLCPRGRLQNLQRNWFGKWKTHIFLTKLQYFTNLDFWWNKGISLPQRPFGVRSCEVAIIWPADLCSITAADFSRLSNICRRVLAASGNLRLQKRQQASSMDLAPGIGVNLGTQFVGKKSQSINQSWHIWAPVLCPKVLQQALQIDAIFLVRHEKAISLPPVKPESSEEKFAIWPHVVCFLCPIGKRKTWVGPKGNNAP